MGILVLNPSKDYLSYCLLQQNLSRGNFSTHTRGKGAQSKDSRLQVRRESGFKSQHLHYWALRLPTNGFNWDLQSSSHQTICFQPPKDGNSHVNKWLINVSNNSEVLKREEIHSNKSSSERAFTVKEEESESEYPTFFYRDAGRGACVRSAGTRGVKAACVKQRWPEGRTEVLSKPGPSRRIHKFAQRLPSLKPKIMHWNIFCLWVTKIALSPLS